MNASDIKIEFNGYDLSDFMTLTEPPVRHAGNERTVNYVGSAPIGGYAESVETAVKKIKVKFYIDGTENSNLQFYNLETEASDKEHTIQAKREALAGIFATDEKGGKLWFSDEPDRYYKAISVDTTELDSVGTGFASGTITFEVPDGVAHSITYKSIEDYTEYAGKLVIDINNAGTAPAYPIITLQNTQDAENGWIGVVNANGVFEAGSKAEEDAVLVDAEDLIFDYYGKDGQAIDTGFNSVVSDKGTTNVFRNKMTQDIHIDRGIWGRNHIALSS